MTTQNLMIESKLFNGTREEYLQKAKDELNSRVFKQAGYEIPEVKISCSWALGTAVKNKKTLGQCVPRSWSKANINEIMIVPTVDDSVEVIDTLAHELVHAIDDCQSGHGAGFKKICLAVGLNGASKMTQACAGEELKATIKDIVKDIGLYPHNELKINQRKKQTTRMLKVSCTECDFSYRTSRKNINMITNHVCNGCGEETLIEETEMSF